MKFEIVGEIRDVETIATGKSIRVLSLLNKRYGKGRWRKRKGVATVKLRTAHIEWPRFIGTRPTDRSAGFKDQVSVH